MQRFVFTLSGPMRMCNEFWFLVFKAQLNVQRIEGSSLVGNKNNTVSVSVQNTPVEIKVSFAIGMIITCNLSNYFLCYLSIVLLVVFYLDFSSAEYCDIHNEGHSMDESETESCSKDYDSSQALVLYSEDVLLPFHKQSRTFKYASRDIVIKQEWKKLGVAAVVWDAVSARQFYIVYWHTSTL